MSAPCHCGHGIAVHQGGQACYVFGGCHLGCQVYSPTKVKPPSGPQLETLKAVPTIPAATKRVDITKPQYAGGIVGDEIIGFDDLTGYEGLESHADRMPLVSSLRPPVRTTLLGVCLPSGFTGTVAMGATVHLTVHPQVPCRTKRFLVDPPIADAFVLNDWRIGCSIQSPSAMSPVPCSLFNPAHYTTGNPMPGMIGETCMPGQVISLSISNCGNRALRFLAAFEVDWISP